MLENLKNKIDIDKKTLFRLSKILFLGVLVVGIFLLGLFSPKIFSKKNHEKKSVMQKIENKHLAFLFGVYTLIQENYWDKISDEQLVNIFILASEKLANQKIEIKTKDKESLKTALLKTINNIKDNDKKNEFAANLADIVLANLQPFGRSRLYSEKQEIDLKNRVENKNPEINQYQILQVDKTASPEAIKKTYEEKSKILLKQNTPESQQKLAEIKKAYEILSDNDNRKTYDKSGVEPTMEWKLLDLETFYLHMIKFSPTTIEELVQITQKVDKDPGPHTLILDLRNNVGGAIDGLPYFLGPFIGNDQYAYQFYHQGNKEDFKTKIGWLPPLVRYKRMIVLINGGTQSSAEVMAAVIKKYNVGIVVGTPSKGWGTVERVFPLEKQIDDKTKYSVFLVHRLTTRDDGQPIEGRGVDPVINITSKNWEKQLNLFFHDSMLIENIKTVWGKI